MRFNILLAATLLMAAVCPSVATAEEDVRPAQAIINIKKENKKTQAYIIAEKIASSEQEAYQGTMAQILPEAEKARDAMAVPDGYERVPDVRNTVNVISLSNGGIYSCFMYVERASLVRPIDDNAETYAETSCIRGIVAEEPENPQEEPEEESLLPEGTKKETPPAVEIAEAEQVAEDYVIAQDEQTEIPASAPTAATTAKVPETRSVAVDDISELLITLSNREDAVKALSTAKNFRRIQGYGRPETCRNTDAAYWVVDGAPTLIVLGPMRSDGTRLNYTTGRPDYLSNYDKVAWFRK